MLKPHSPEWYERLARMQRGYFYPWRSEIAPENGEDAYLRLVREHLVGTGQDMPPGRAGTRDVLDAGCGHGEVALDFAPLAGRIVAYDRVAAFVELGRETALARGVSNVEFVLGDSSPEANGGRPRIPAGDTAFDLIISRRGPTNWIEDARRVVRPGAVLIQLNPMEAPNPPWNDELPANLRFVDPGDYSIRASIERRLGIGGLSLHSAWVYDVPEWLADARQLYVYLAFGRTPGEAPAWDEVRDAFEGVFARHATRRGLVLRHRRLLWKAVVD
jgi:23S rRNA (guanine745-N1)-methyltransferase